MCSFCKNEFPKRNKEEGGNHITIILAVIVGVCVYTDLKNYRIPNKILLVGLLVGLAGQLIKGGIVPLGNGILSMGILWLLLYPLFLIRAFGAGDIKLMCVVAGFMNPKTAIHFMIISFMMGGILSLIKMFVNRNLRNRFRKFFQYIHTCIRTRSFSCYEKPFQETTEQKKTVIHFSIPIAVSTYFWLGGMYI